MRDQATFLVYHGVGGRKAGKLQVICMCCNNALFLVLFANSWWPPLMKILTHQPHYHTPSWWRTAVLHLSLYMEGWSMSVQVWVLAPSTKMFLRTHTTGTVSSVASKCTCTSQPTHAMGTFLSCNLIWKLLGGARQEHIIFNVFKILLISNH